MTSHKFNALGYRDCHRIMAMANTRPGLLYVFDELGQAINFKQRCNIYRTKLREKDAEVNSRIPGYLPESPFDILIIRQVDESGTPARTGKILRFDHERGGGGRLVDPVTGEELNLDDLTIDFND